jgi:hypothetical protein
MPAESSVRIRFDKSPLLDALGLDAFVAIEVEHHAARKRRNP